MCLLLTWRNDDKPKVTGITCANMQHLNYLLRSSGGFNRPRCVLDSSQMHHLTPTRIFDTRDRNTFLPSFFASPHARQHKRKIHCVSNERYFSSTVHGTVKFTRLTPFAGKNEFFNARPGRVSHCGCLQPATRAQSSRRKMRKILGVKCKCSCKLAWKKERWRSHGNFPAGNW